jgi:hypothetical protein
MWQFHIRAKDTLKNSYATNCLEDELTISGPNDKQAPSAVFVSVTPSTASPGDQVTFRWTAADESGVDWTAVMLCSPVNSMLTSATLVGGNAVEGTYEAVITIPAGYPGGMWQFHIRAKDTLKNSYATNCLEDELTISD